MAGIDLLRVLLGCANPDRSRLPVDRRVVVRPRFRWIAFASRSRFGRVDTGAGPVPARSALAGKGLALPTVLVVNSQRRFFGNSARPVRAALR
jgi:hypothetical protein